MRKARRKNPNITKLKILRLNPQGRYEKVIDSRGDLCVVVVTIRQSRWRRREFCRLCEVLTWPGTTSRYCFDIYNHEGTNTLRVNYLPLLSGSHFSSENSRYVESEMAEIEQNWTASTARRAVAFVKIGKQTFFLIFQLPFLPYRYKFWIVKVVQNLLDWVSSRCAALKLTWKPSKQSKTFNLLHALLLESYAAHFLHHY